MDFNFKKLEIMNIKRELPLLIIVLLPFLYLAYIWNDLPAQVAMQYKWNGEISRYGSKSELILLPILLPLLTYLIFTAIPKIDPKRKLDDRSKKFQSLKFLMVTFTSILALVLLYSDANESFFSPNVTVLLIGVLYIILGNYFKTIKANYFIGIRTPWTLENETVWKETHKFGGKLWFVGGIIVVISRLVLREQINFTVFLVVTGIIAFVPIIYSYFIFKKLEVA